MNGKNYTGYIYKKDVENAVTNQKALRGIATKNPTKVYRTASTTASALKSYANGSILSYRTFSTNWYQATVYVNGKNYTGYIYKKDVENAVTNQKALRGIATKNPTKVYRTASTTASALKSYANGSILSYRTFSTNWYQATVYVNGKNYTGYIYKKDVENAVTNQKALRGIATKNPTKVYRTASTTASALKSYANGSILSYRTFSTNWYQATVYVNGKKYTGYIYKKDVENSVSTQKILTGVVYVNRGVNVYAKASTSSSILKSYPKGKTLKYKTFTSGWYEATVYINGKPKTGYIKKSDMEAGLHGKIIIVDAGHGGKDSGASGNGIIEKKLNLSVALELANKLRSGGATVYLTRSTDTYITLNDRAAVAKKMNADIFVSIHANSASASASASGIETYYNQFLFKGAKNPYPAESKRLAQCIQTNLVQTTKMKNRGVKEDAFVVLRENTVPSVLVELGFLTNKNDAAIMKKSDYKNKAAQGIYNGIEAYFQ